MTDFAKIEDQIMSGGDDFPSRGPCDACGDYHYYGDMNEVGEDFYCDDCYAEILDQKQEADDADEN